MSCPAALVHRNYFAPDGDGQDRKQIDCLEDIGTLLGGDALWRMQNGYCLPLESNSMRDLVSRIQASGRSLEEEVEARLRVGVNWETQVVPPHTHRVTQVFCSALPVSYDKVSASWRDWEPFARLVLRATYDAALCAARVRAAALGRRVTVFLTCVGGGAFGNEPGWIADAISAALARHAAAPLDVRLVHFRGIEGGPIGEIPEISRVGDSVAGL